MCYVNVNMCYKFIIKKKKQDLRFNTSICYTHTTILGEIFLNLQTLQLNVLVWARFATG